MFSPSQTGIATDWKNPDTEISKGLDPSSNGWNVGSFVNAFRQVQSLHNAPRWQIQPALLLGIHRQAPSNVQFTVVYLYDQKVAAEGLSMLGIYARYKAIISMWTWPQEHRYVISSRVEKLNEWDLRTWSRSDLPSVSDRWALDPSSNRLVRCDISLRKVVQTALNLSPRFQYLHQLPREVRDQIYNHLLFDEQQRTVHSRIHISSLLSAQADRKNHWSLYNVSFRMPQVPKFHTPCILRVCKWLRSEALEALYRTKTLVITVSYPKHGFWSCTDDYWPDIRRFQRIRVDIVVDQEAVHVMSECFQYVARLLSKEQAPSLRILELRLGFLHSRAPIAVADDIHTVTMSREAVFGLMSHIRPVLKERTNSQFSVDYRPVQLVWGVSKTQIEDKDYDCYCSYLSQECLQRSWEQSSSEDNSPLTDVHLDLAQQNCQLFGCIYHRFTS